MEQLPATILVGGKIGNRRTVGISLPVFSEDHQRKRKQEIMEASGWDYRPQNTWVLVIFFETANDSATTALEQ